MTEKAENAMKAGRRIAWLVALTIVGGGVAKWGSEWTQPIPPALPYNDAHPTGFPFCSALAEAAQHRSSQWLACGTALIVLGVAAAVIGTISGPGKEEGQTVRSRIHQNRNVVAALIGGILTSAGWLVVQRSDAATTLGSGATLALNEETDRAAYVACVTHRASWLGDRLDHTALRALSDLGKKDDSPSSKKPNGHPSAQPEGSATVPSSSAAASDGAALSRRP